MSDLIGKFTTKTKLKALQPLPLVVEKHYIPHLKALINGFDILESQGRDGEST